MNGKRKAVLGVDSTENGRTEKAACGAAISYTHSTTTAADRQAGFVEGFLFQGESRAISTAALVSLCGFRNARELRAEIERERANGALILSTVRGHGGYFLPSDDAGQAREEIASFVRTVNARAVNSLRTLKSARLALKECEAQIELEGVQ